MLNQLLRYSWRLLADQVVMARRRRVEAERSLVRVSARLTRTEKQKFRVLAQTEGETEASFLRLLIAERLEQEEDELESGSRRRPA